MRPDRYDTVAPGAGRYRFQSEFGIYSASDTFNYFNADMLSRTGSQPDIPGDRSKSQNSQIDEKSSPRISTKPPSVSKKIHTPKTELS